MEGAVIRILSPVNGPHEVEAVIDAGAGEIYCGVMSGAWKKTYTNVASPNRREWASANMATFDDLGAVVDAAHGRNIPVFLTLNALYTEKQYPEVRAIVRESADRGVDALIIADMGVLLTVRDMGWSKEIHVSTGGTTFNDETVAFYRSLDACRVIIPRQNRIQEIMDIVAHNPGIDIETFIMNSGCLNIDGFCTHHHGTRELKRPLWWNIPKKLHADHYVLWLLKKLPNRLRSVISRPLSRTADSACLLDYQFDVASSVASPEEQMMLSQNLKRNTGVFMGFDACGACALWDLERAGIASVKIVGRNNPTRKKIKDVRFLKTCLDQVPLLGSPDEFADFVKREYRKVYGYSCGEWCYYPAQDRSIPAGVL
jgi:collagenase-like PrtC family protease